MRFSTIVLLLLSVRAGCGLRVTRGSPCESECAQPNSTTTGDDIVCRDGDFSRGAGLRFQNCVKCELRSNFNSVKSGESDVKWGLYNIRYAFSSCIYGIPAAKQSLSTPCQVSCQNLERAMSYGLTNPDGPSSYDFCSLSSLADPVVTKCAACYGRTEDEKFLANFIESLREGCLAKVPDGTQFLLDPDRIFTTDILPATTAPVVPQPSDPNAPKSTLPLVYVIVFPILGFFLLLIGCCVGCFFCVRHRRRKAKRTSQNQNQAYFQERWNDTGIMSPLPVTIRNSWGEPNSPYHPQVYSPYPQDVKYPPQSYQMDNSPSTSSPAGQSVQYVPNTNVPVLSPPPPPRKSLSGP